jgi:hypothetical protein
MTLLGLSPQEPSRPCILYAVSPPPHFTIRSHLKREILLFAVARLLPRNCIRGGISFYYIPSRNNSPTKLVLGIKYQLEKKLSNIIVKMQSNVISSANILLIMQTD